MSPIELQSRYFNRLKLDPAKLDSEPSFRKLAIIQEAHLAAVPFDNLAQHGAVGGLAVLDRNATAIKILDRQRGGFCFELNAVLGELLVDLGYGATLLSAFVYAGDPGYCSFPTHMALIVRCHRDTVQESTHFVDVGFAEPPLHPLVYGTESFGIVQETPDGMRSRLLEEDGSVVLEWYVAGKWTPRLRWSLEDSMLGDQGPELASFATALDSVHEESSIFSQKLISCLITRTEKVTLAGKRLKITGPPRFPLEEGAEVSIQQLEGVSEARIVLRDRFGIPLVETVGLDLTKSSSAAAAVWAKH